MSASMNDIVRSLIRTIAPQIAAVIVLQVARVGFSIDPSTTEQIVTAAVYYLAARLLEVSRSPRWGWLLGHPSAPTYTATEPKG
jgi:hypothetical protein